MYITAEQLQGYMGESQLAMLTNDVDPSIVDTTKAEEVINLACQIIDAYLANKYVVPLVLTENEDAVVIQDICKRLCHVKLLAPRLDAMNLPESYKVMSAEVFADLVKLQRGELVLKTISVESRPPTSRVSSKTRVFTDEMLAKVYSY